MSEDSESAEEKDLAIVFRTAQYTEAASLTAMLNDAKIPAVMFGAQHNTMVLMGGGEAFAIRIAVPAEYEKESVALIEAYMQSIGSAPTEEPESAGGEEDVLLPCPNCEAVGIALRKPCAGCGYEILRAGETPVSVREHTPDARSFCPECRDPLTFSSGECGRCGEELEPLEKGDRICPALEHVLYRDTVGGDVCKACRRVWVDVAAG